MSTIPGVSDADLSAVQALVAGVAYNATITLNRPGVRGQPETVVQAGRRCRLRRPNETAEQTLPDGTAVSYVLYDVPDAPYRLNDIVVVTQRDGQTTLGPITQFRVGSVEASPQLIPQTIVALVGMGDYR